MITDNSDPISIAFKSAVKITEQKRIWLKSGYLCDPCDPLLPLNHPNAFYGENSLIIDLIARLIEFIQGPKDQDLLFLKGPKGSGKSIFAQIFERYRQQLNLSISYQDASGIITIQTDQMNIRRDVIFLDNAFHWRNTLKSMFNSPTSDYSPKIIAIMDSTEFEIYRRHCIKTGDSSYQNFFSMPHYSHSDLYDLLIKRLVICFGETNLPPKLEGVTKKIAELSFGNPGVAIRILEEKLRFSRTLEDLRLSFGIVPKAMEDFSSSKAAILREILIRERKNDFLPSQQQNFIIHKALTSLMNKTKSTISHHLSDLLNRNLIFEQPTTRDKREKAYRPNKAIIGILEYLVFETFPEDAYITLDGTYYEK
ncbi:MAG: hypothetical protein ACW964_17625 [Candidatus Hodarchaeales archaeon]